MVRINLLPKTQRTTGLKARWLIILSILGFGFHVQAQSSCVFHTPNGTKVTIQASSKDAALEDAIRSCFSHRKNWYLKTHGHMASAAKQRSFIIPCANPACDN